MRRSPVLRITALLLAGVPLSPLVAADAELQVPRFSDEALGPPPPPWQFAGLAHQTKPRTQFAVVDDEGTHVLSVISDHSYGNLMTLGKHPLSPSTTLSWRWKLDVPNLLADLRTRDGDDAPIKVCVSFDYDSDGLSLVQRTELALARSSLPEPVPIATLCYVWDHRLPEGTTLVNAFTDRIRYLVLESGEAKLHAWVDEHRAVEQDFWTTFGPEFRPKAPDDLPGLVAILVGGDADNTAQVTRGAIGDVVLSRR